MIFPSNGSAAVPYEFYLSLPSPFHERYLYMPKPPFLYRAPEFFPIELLERRPIVKWHMCLDVLEYTLEVKKKKKPSNFIQSRSLGTLGVLPNGTSYHV